MKTPYYERKDPTSYEFRNERISIVGFEFEGVAAFLKQFGEATDISAVPEKYKALSFYFCPYRKMWALGAYKDGIGFEEFIKKYFVLVEPPVWAGGLPELEVVYEFAPSSGRITVHSEVMPGVYAGERGGVNLILKRKN